MNAEDYRQYRFGKSRRFHLFAGMNKGDSFGGIEAIDRQAVATMAWEWGKAFGCKFSVMKDLDNPGTWKCTRIA